MSSVVTLFVTHSKLKKFSSELRFPLEKSVGDIKFQLSQKCGTDISMMTLHLQDDVGHTLFSSLEDDNLLGFYSPVDGYFDHQQDNFGQEVVCCSCVLHVVDLDEQSKDWMEDLSQVEKFTLSDEAYDNREDSFRAFKKRMNLTKTQQKSSCTLQDPEIKVDINVGDRCQVTPGDKRGVVKYVGKVSQLNSGIWIGVCYDEPLGKNDGSIGEERLFSCDPNHGAFVRPTNVHVGDYPPYDDEFADEI